MAKRSVSKAQAGLFAEEPSPKPTHPKTKHIRFEPPPTPKSEPTVYRTITTIAFDANELTLDCVSDETVEDHRERAIRLQATQALPPIEITTEVRAAMARLNPFTGLPLAPGEAKPAHPGPCVARDIEPPGIGPRPRKTKIDPEASSVTRERIERVIYLLKSTDEWSQYREAYIAQRDAPSKVVRVVKGAEGDYPILTTSKPEFTLAFRDATKAAESKAIALGAKPGDWYAIAMRIERSL